jgi:hypothetical protein
MSLFPIVDGRARFDASSNADSDRYSAGIRFTQEGAARSMTSAGTFFNQGIPMSDSGQVALVDASSGLPVNVVWLSGLPISNDRVCISNKPVSVVSSGIPYDSAGAVAATVAPITTNATLDLVFAGVSNDLLNPTSYTLTTDFITPQYQVGAQYTVWDNGLVQKNFADIVTFTRASTGTYFNSAGTLTTAAINEARFDFNPSTLAAQGLLIEESRTNSIRNNTMVGAVAGTPGTLPTNWATVGGGLTTEVVGVGTLNGISYIDIRYSGTKTSTGISTVAFEASTATAALNNQTWTNSSWVSIVGGSTTNITSFILIITVADSGGAYLTQYNSSNLPVGATFTRFTHTATIANASTAYARPVFGFSAANGAAIDITLRIGLPQLEQGAFATSVIPTTTTALTRAADVASVNTLSPWYNAVEGTLYSEGSVASFAATPAITSFSDGTDTGNLIQTNTSSLGVVRLRVTIGGVAQVNNMSSGVTATANTTFKSASAYKASDFAISVNAAAAATQASGSVPTPTQLRLMQTGSAGSISTGHLRRITYYPRRLSNADLQTITT